MKRMVNAKAPRGQGRKKRNKREKEWEWSHWIAGPEKHIFSSISVLPWRLGALAFTFLPRVHRRLSQLVQGPANGTEQFIDLLVRRRQRWAHGDQVADASDDHALFAGDLRRLRT